MSEQTNEQAAVRALLQTPAAREVIAEIFRAEFAKMQTSAPDDEEVLTVREVARAKRVSPRTVYGWASSNLIRHSKTPGGQLRFKRSEVDRFNVTAL